MTVSYYFGVWARQPTILSVAKYHTRFLGGWHVLGGVVA